MATSQLEITPHLASPEQLAQAAAVYYEGFAHKLDGLEFISRPPAQAIRILIASIQPEMATYALLARRAVGVAGLQHRGRRLCVVPGRVWRARVKLSRRPKRMGGSSSMMRMVSELMEILSGRADGWRSGCRCRGYW